MVVVVNVDIHNMVYRFMYNNCFMFIPKVNNIKRHLYIIICEKSYFKIINSKENYYLGQTRREYEIRSHFHIIGYFEIKFILIRVTLIHIT